MSLEGVYRTHLTLAELAKSPDLVDQEELNDENWGVEKLTLRDGRWTLRQRNPRSSSTDEGTYKREGDALYLRSTTTGETFAFRWSLYRGFLTFRRDERLGLAPTPFLVKPWRRGT